MLPTFQPLNGPMRTTNVLKGGTGWEADYSIARELIYVNFLPAREALRMKPVSASLHNSQSVSLRQVSHQVRRFFPAKMEP